MENLDSISNRLFESGQQDFAASCQQAAEQLAPLCESQIEVMLLGAIYLSGSMSQSRLIDGGKLIKVTQDKEVDLSVDDGSGAAFVVQPQYVWRNFRIDFCISVMLPKNRGFRFFVECDGHDFHERTKEQAERDRARDREIQAANIPILRFTGREIFRDPFACVVEIFDFVSAKVSRAA